MLLVDQVQRRTAFLNQYIDQISKKLTNKKYKEALDIITKQKNHINHTSISTYKPNSFLIDSLKAKRDKLKQEINELNAQKNRRQQEFKIQKVGVSQPLKKQTVLAYFSRIEVTLKQFKKVEYQQAVISSDYQYFVFTNDNTQQKIKLSKISEVERKKYYLSIQASNSKGQSVYFLLKFDSDSKITKWQNSFTYGKILQQHKNKRYLFMAVNDKQDVVNSRASTIKTPSQSDVAFNSNNFTNFFGNRQNQQTSRINTPPNNSNNNPFFKTNPLPESPFGQKGRTMTSSFIMDRVRKNSFANADRPIRKNSVAINHFVNQRPPPLNSIRKTSIMDMNPLGKSFLNTKTKNTIEEESEIASNTNLDSLEKSSKFGFRNGSDEVTMRTKKTTQHEMKLERFKSQKSLVDDLLLSQVQNNKYKRSHSKKLQSQIEKKNELLQRNRNLSGSSFMGKDEQKKWIQQKDSISLQSNSNKLKNNFQDKAKFQEDSFFGLDNKEEKNVSQKQIKEQSERNQQSPTFPKKVNYIDGNNIRLIPVQDTQFLQQSSNHESEQEQEVGPLNSVGQEEQQNPFSMQRQNTMESETDKEHQYHESNPSQQDHEVQEFEAILDQLKKGLVLTKCAEKGFWTREKKLNISDNQNTLLSVDVKDKKMKKIPIGDIQSVEYGKYGKGIIKHISQIQEKKCLIISILDGKQTKKLQFVGNNPQKLQAFVINLNYYIEIFKKS